MVVGGGGGGGAAAAAAEMNVRKIINKNGPKIVLNIKVLLSLCDILSQF